MGLLAIKYAGIAAKVEVAAGICYGSDIKWCRRRACRGGRRRGEEEQDTGVLTKVLEGYRRSVAVAWCTGDIAPAPPST